MLVRYKNQVSTISVRYAISEHSGHVQLLHSKKGACPLTDGSDHETGEDVWAVVSGASLLELNWHSGCRCIGFGESVAIRSCFRGMIHVKES